MSSFHVVTRELDTMYNELKHVTLDTKEIIERYKDILSRLNSGWVGEEQENFKNSVIYHLENMEQLTEMCDEYCIELSNAIRCYKESEELLTAVVATRYL
jgi:uncharacterized protein YukE